MKSETMFFWEIIKEKNWLNKSQCYTYKNAYSKKTISSLPRKTTYYTEIWQNYKLHVHRSILNTAFT